MSAETPAAQTFVRDVQATLAFSCGRNTVRPSFFGPPSRRLFGIYEAPAADVARDHGVVLCYPHGRDYVAAFRAFRVLSTRLSAAGFHVLRFDYAGTGDSWGEVEDGSVRQWVDDIVSAMGILTAAHDCREVALVGLRLGAGLAAFAAAESERVDRIVLWQPVLDGGEYVRELRARHAAWLEGEAHERRHAPTLAGDDELLGYRFTASMQRDLEGFTLRSLTKAPAPDVQIIVQDPHADGPTFAEHVRALGARVDVLNAVGPKVWSTTPGMEQGLVPNEVVRGIVDWLAGSRR